MADLLVECLGHCKQHGLGELAVVRERAGEILKRLAYTADLDGVMMFRPWEPRPAGEEYWRAVKAGAIPPYLPENDIDASETIHPGFREWVEYENQLTEEAPDARDVETEG